MNRNLKISLTLLMFVVIFTTMGSLVSADDVTLMLTDGFNCQTNQIVDRNYDPYNFYFDLPGIIANDPDGMFTDCSQNTLGDMILPNAGETFCYETGGLTYGPYDVIEDVEEDHITFTAPTPSMTIDSMSPAIGTSLKTDLSPGEWVLAKALGLI